MSGLDDTLPGKLLAKRDWLRDDVIPAYESIGPAGGFAISWMRLLLARTDAALLTHDVVEMVSCLKELNEVSL